MKRTTIVAILFALPFAALATGGSVPGTGRTPANPPKPDIPPIIVNLPQSGITQDPEYENASRTV